MLALLAARLVRIKNTVSRFWGVQKLFGIHSRKRTPGYPKWRHILKLHFTSSHKNNLLQVPQVEKKNMIFNYGGSPLFCTLFGRKHMVLLKLLNIHHKYFIWVYHMNLATVEALWQFPELKTQFQPKPRHNLNQNMVPNKKKVVCTVHVLFFQHGFFKVFQTPASLEAPKCCTSRYRLICWKWRSTLQGTNISHLG